MKIQLTKKESQLLEDLLTLDLEELGYENKQIKIFEKILDKLSPNKNNKSTVAPTRPSPVVIDLVKLEEFKWEPPKPIK